MKKVFLIITLLLFIFITSYDKLVYANEDEEIKKDLIIVQSKESYDFSYSGYEIISSTVKEDVPGDYFIVYRNYLSNEQVIKKVKVVSRSDIYKKYYTIKNEEILLDSAVNILKYIVTNNNEIIMVKEIMIDSNQQDEDKSNYYLTMIKDNKVVFETEIMDDCYGSITEIKIHNNNIYLLGSRYFLYGGIEIFIGKYDLNGNELCFKYIGGNLNDNPKSIEIINDTVYVIGDTVSLKGDIYTTNSDVDTFIVKLDEKFKVEKFLNLGEVKNDTSYESISFNNNIYIIKHSIDEKINIPVLSIIKLDHNLDNKIESIIDIGFGHQVLDIKENEENIVLTRIKDNDLNNNQDIYVESITQELICTNLFQKEFPYSLIIIDAAVSNNTLSILFNTYENNIRYTNILIYDIFEKDIKQDIKYQNDYFKIELLNMNEVLLLNKDYCITKQKLSSIKINDFGLNEVENDSDDVYETNVIINGEKAILNRNKSDIEYNPNLFGQYKTLYYFGSDDFIFMYQKDINVCANISVLNNNTYDTNISLTFNGIGILNNEKVESGYIIENPGEYNLKVYGKENTLIDISFKVDNLSIKSNDLIESNININKDNIFKAEQIIPSDKLKSSVVITESTDNKVKKKVIYWPIIIPTSLFMICTIYILKGRYS